MATPAVRADGLSKRYGTVDALKDLTLEVHPGEALGYLGPNGAGKTTTIRLLLGLARPTSGRAEIFGRDSQTETVRAHRHLAYVPGEALLWPALTGAETLHLLAAVHGSVERAYQAELIERFQLDPSKKVRAYSKGNRQKVLLIAAFAARPDLLLLDEPTAGLDPIMEQTFRACVRDAQHRGQTIFLSSHSLSEVESLCERIAILRDGALAEIGTMSQLRHLSDLLVEATFDGSPPNLTDIAGVTALTADGNRVRFHVRGPVEPILQVLATVNVERLLIREPSLEELFLAHYGGPPRPVAETADGR
jgi:ABC-2 type transport system ATP-binding protein